MIDIAAPGNWMWSARPGGRPAHSHLRARRGSREGPTLEPSERILGEVALRDGGTALATDRALISGAADGTWRRLRWADIAAAAWLPARAATVISLWPDGNGSPGCVELLTDRRFALLAADRVAATQVLRRRVQLTARVAATVLATRGPGEDVAWRVLLDAGSEDGPDVQRAARQALIDLRGLAGC